MPNRPTFSKELMLLQLTIPPVIFLASSPARDDEALALLYLTPLYREIPKRLTPGSEYRLPHFVHLRDNSETVPHPDQPILTDELYRGISQSERPIACRPVQS